MTRDHKAGVNGCDCGDAGCQLPPGRCMLCAQPCQNDQCFPICGGCEPKIRDLHAGSSQDSQVGGCGLRCNGWFLFNGYGDGSVNIERCDACAVFDRDDDAAIHVRGRLAMAANDRIQRPDVDNGQSLVWEETEAEAARLLSEALTGAEREQLARGRGLMAGAEAQANNRLWGPLGPGSGVVVAGRGDRVWVAVRRAWVAGQPGLALSEPGGAEVLVTLEQVRVAR